MRLVVLGDITIMLMSLLSMYRRFLPSHWWGRTDYPLVPVSTCIV
jgi:hypothetical protein